MSFYLIDHILTDDGIEPCLPEGIDRNGVLFCSGQGIGLGWALYVVPGLELSDYECGLESVMELPLYLQDTLSAAEEYPPAMGLAVDDIKREFGDTRTQEKPYSKMEFIKRIHEVLTFRLGQMASQHCFLAEWAHDGTDVGFTKGTYYWILDCVENSVSFLYDYDEIIQTPRDSFNLTLPGMAERIELMRRTDSQLNRPPTRAESKCRIVLPAINPDSYRKIVFLTGPGISAASGIPTRRARFRAWPDGADDPEEDRQASTRLWEQIRRARPNAAHLAITDFQRRAGPGTEVRVLTENVDGLHQCAGTISVLELHGSALRVRCPQCCGQSWNLDLEAVATPLCEECRQPARPDVLLVYERLPSAVREGLTEALSECDLLIVVGTGGPPMQAHEIQKATRGSSPRTICVDGGPFQDGLFDETFRGQAEFILPELLGFRSKLA